MGYQIVSLNLRRLLVLLLVSVKFGNLDAGSYWPSSGRDLVNKHYSNDSSAESGRIAERNAIPAGSGAYCQGWEAMQFDLHEALIVSSFGDINRALQNEDQNNAYNSCT